MLVEATHEHVVKHAQVGDERACLRDQGGVLRITPVYRVEEGRLASARTADDRHPLSRLDREGDVVEDECALVARTYAFERDGGSHRGSALSRAWFRRRLPRSARTAHSRPG